MSIRENSQAKTKIAIVGNKIDLETDINNDEIIELAYSFGCIHTEISVKTSQNLKELFEIITRICLWGLYQDKQKFNLE